MLYSQMEPPPALEGEFNEWYASEHIPVRLALPGFVRAVRYRELDGERKYLAIYEIDDLSVLDSPGYQVLKTSPSERTARMLRSVQGFTRFTCEQVFDTGRPAERSGYLLAVAFTTPDAQRSRVMDGYERQRAGVTRAPGCLRARGYKVTSADGGPWTDFVLYDLRFPDAARDLARDLVPALQGSADASTGEALQSRQWLYALHSAHESR